MTVVRTGCGYPGVGDRLLGAAAVALAGAALGAAGCGEAAAKTDAAGARPLSVTRVFGEVGLNPGQFTYPRAMDSDGRSLYVIDKAAHVQRLDPATGRATAMWTMPDSALGKPCGVTVGPDGLIYVADTHYFRVMVYKPPARLGQEPELVAKWGEYGTGPGQFIYPTDVAILTGPDGAVERIYVSEYGGNDRISVFDREHRFLFSIGKFGSGDGSAATIAAACGAPASAEADGGGTGVEFSRPQSIQIDPRRGWLIVTDAVNHRVGVLTLDGKLVRWIGSPDRAGSGRDEFAYPYGLVLLEDGTALVTETGNHRVHHLDPATGATLGLYGTPGHEEGQLTNPWAIARIGKAVYVLDSGNARVEAFGAPTN